MTIQYNQIYFTFHTCIYTIILLKAVCLPVLANCRSQFLLDRLGRCLKLFVSTESTSCHEIASQFGQDIFLYVKITQNYREYHVAYATVYLNEAATGHSSPADLPHNVIIVFVSFRRHLTS